MSTQALADVGACAGQFTLVSLDDQITYIPGTCSVFSVTLWVVSVTWKPISILTTILEKARIWTVQNMGNRISGFWQLCLFWVQFISEKSVSNPNHMYFLSAWKITQNIERNIQQSPKTQHWKGELGECPVPPRGVKNHSTCSEAHEREDGRKRPRPSP